MRYELTVIINSVKKFLFYNTNGQIDITYHKLLQNLVIILEISQPEIFY